VAGGAMSEDLIQIAGEGLSAAINLLGAELTWLRDAGGRELMTDADPAFWTGRAPILFPVVGRLNGDVLRIDGVEYPMKQHGFARRMAFAVTGHDAHSATFRLTDTPDTRAAYPFPFVLEIGFAIKGTTLTMRATIINPGALPLPASFGWHPAFAWPLPYGHLKEAHRVTFSADEPDPLWEVADGLIVAERPPSPLEGGVLSLDDSLFEHDALIWNPVHSNRVSYGAPHGPALEVAFPDTPQLGIWTKPGARFLCIEPWHGHADRQGFTGDFRDKPGIFEIAPGRDWHCSVSVTLRT
jgi:galactose mutarotase-like enzyme